jgi:hypothetical protein
MTTASSSKAPKNSGNWSGFELRSTPGSFGWVSAQWTVPSVTAEAGLVTTTYSSTWVGLDGDATTDLVQAGSEQDVMRFLWFTFSVFRAWTEFLPQQPTESVISNFNLSPGDRMFVEVYVGNAGGMPNHQGFFGQFVVINLTTGVGGWNYTPRGTTVVGGSEAEWIMERPTVNGSLADLANYGAASTDFGWARKPNAGFTTCCGSTSINITMTNGGTTLSTASAPNDQTSNSTWKAFH